MTTLFNLKFYLILTCCMAGLISGIAQPSNDDCSSATPLLIAIDSASCVPIIGDTRNTQNAIDIEGPEVCSSSWYSDDVWYSIEIGNELPPNGVTLEVRLDPDSGTELTEHGLALYFNDCSSTSEPIDCFSDEPGKRTILIPPFCIEANTKYIVRLWSAPEPFDNSGTFSICAYETPMDTTVISEPMPRVIYEEYFDTGFNGWESMAVTETYCPNSQQLEPDHWLWSPSNCIPNAFGGSDCLERIGGICIESGTVGFPSGWYSSGKDTNGNISPPYPIKESYLVSPSIDLSNESCVNLTWLELHRGLNGSDISDLGPTVEFSIDGGQNWIPPSPRINSIDVSINYGGQNVRNGPSAMLTRKIPLYGAEGNPNVKIRFGFKGDFYYWLIDDVKIIEAETYNLTSNDKHISQSTINPMSIYQIDPINFHSNVTNSGCENQNNIELNISGVNSNGNEIFNESRMIDSLTADERTDNQYISSPFIPEAEVDNYTFTYTVTSDEHSGPNDNIASFDVDLVDEMVFRKENGEVTGGLNPYIYDTINKPQAYWWEMGNIFFAPNAVSPEGLQLRFNKISFKLKNHSEQNGRNFKICLYKIQDQNLDSLLSRNMSAEITLLGTRSFFIPWDSSGLVTASLAPYQGEEDKLNIEANTNYMASIQSDISIDFPMIVASNDLIDYSLTNSLARENANGDPSQMRYTHAYSIALQDFRLIPAPIEGNTKNSFDGSAVPIIRLGYEVVEPSSTSRINENISLSFSPNPVHSELRVNILAEVSMDMKVSILSINGQSIFSKTYQGISSLNEDFDVSDFANGVYMIHVQTKDGIQTKKFVVSR